MTRITNFHLKRTHVEAGFTNELAVESPSKSTYSRQEIIQVENAVDTGDTVTSQTPKKKRKRTKKSQRDGAIKERNDKETEDSLAKESRAEGGDEEVMAKPSHTQKPKPKKKARVKEKTSKFRVKPSESRREKRQSERQANTICFACREHGHAAKDCPSSLHTLGNLENDTVGEKPALGICYRCGSKRHSLSRCKKPENTSNPLPFATCFVCSGNGHLSSACPQNKGKGVYPNGGCCKLCGDTSHLAKDCGLRRQENSADVLLFGSAPDAGADEDDFHVFKRRKVQVDNDHREERRWGYARTDVSIGVTETSQTSKKKVVYF